MNPAIEALKRDLVSLMAEVLVAPDEPEVTMLLRTIQREIEAGLAGVETRS